MLDYSHLIQTVRLCGSSSIRETIAAIDAGRIGFALVLDDLGRLEATVSDGDIRRALLGGLNLSNNIGDLLEYRQTRNPRQPITAPLEVERSVLLQLMQTNVLRHIPLVDANGVVRKIVTLQELVLEEDREVRALIMAGGFGKRLRPLTLDMPKPMLNLGDRPILEHVLTRLTDAGIREVNISTHYKAEKIRSYFQDGTTLGLEINYIHETEPLGTAGALSLIGRGEGPILVMNGDILCNIDFSSMRAYHREHGAALTVAVGIQETIIPFGVVECERGLYVERIQEKPTFRLTINAGIYLIEPEVCTLLEPGSPVDMPDLIAKAIARGFTVIAFPLREGWIDIGTPEDYARAQEHLSILESARPC